MNQIFALFKKKIPKEYLNKIEEEYVEIKNSYVIGDKTKIGIHAGRFCELISSLLCYKELKKKEDLNKISFDKNYKSLIQSSKKTAREELIGSNSITGVCHSSNPGV